MDRPEDQIEGIIKCYYPLKGYGFIQRKTGKDVFFLRTDAQTEQILEDGALVKFILIDDVKGPRAVRLVRLG